MIAVIQRAKDAYVTVNGKVIGQIGKGVVVLLGVCRDDQESDAEFLSNKIASLRIFNDENEKMNLSIKNVNGSALVISQFTLCGDWKKGRRPSFVNAAPPEKGNKLYEYFIDQLKYHQIPVESGIFGSMMQVHLVNDGPVTFVIDSRK